MIEANISMVTLGVESLSASKAFYHDLGWTLCEGSNDNVAFFDGGHVTLSLYGRTALAEDVGVVDDGAGFRAVTCALLQPDEAAVDAYMARAGKAGAKIVKIAEKTFWGGYSGYVSDPDSHLWEIAYNPFVSLDESGRMKMEPIA